MGVLRLVCERAVPVAKSSLQLLARGRILAGIAAALLSWPSEGEAVAKAPPGSQDDAVVALLRKGAILCSGALISPRVVLSAAHCFAEGSDPGPLSVVFGNEADAVRGVPLRVIDVRLHPAFDRETFANDIALLLLEGNAPAASLALARAPFSEIELSSEARLIGFGQSTKRSGLVTLSAIEDFRLRFAPRPAQACVGDSGGPVVRRREERDEIIAVTSSGARSCSDGHWGARVDAYLASFVEPYLAETAAHAAKPGARCFTDDNCASGRCFRPEDAPHRGYCSTRCERDSGCPEGMACQGPARVCRYPPPSPGALGMSCRMPWDCGRGVCARPKSSAAAVCTSSCLGSNLACPPGYACLRNVLAPPDAAPKRACFRQLEPPR